MSPSQPALQPRTSGDERPVILVVDDHAENLRLLSHMLIQAGYRVRVANSGERALESVRTTPPDLILLDIMMPDMDGYAVAEQLHADREAGLIAEEVPILFVSALRDADDKVKAFAAGGVDYVPKPFQSAEVLARVRTHLAMRRLQRDLEAQVAELNAYAHTVAHDLKGPLNTLTSYAELLSLLDPGSDDALRNEAIQGIRSMGHKMGQIIDALLLLAAVRQTQGVPLLPVDTPRLVAAACRRLEAAVAERGARIEVPSSWPAALGYGPWVEEVWANLLANAIHYGGRAAEGLPPVVELGADPAPASDGTVRFWVRDNGPGVPPEAQSRLFVEFQRLHHENDEGHGLGLSIVRRIVERLGGRVGVEGVPGAGSRFFFTLPADPD